MSKMKSMLGLFAGLSAMSITGAGMSSGINSGLSDETESERKERLSKAENRRNKDRGLTEFFYGTNSIWALNQKVADKKARKRNWL